MWDMARAPTTLTPVNAIAEPRRRRIVLETLAGGGELPVNDLVGRLGWPQPTVSKHLGVLKTVGLVSMRRTRRQLYSVNGKRITLHSRLGQKLRAPLGGSARPCERAGGTKRTGARQQSFEGESI